MGNQLPDLGFVAIEAMDNPSLAGMVFFVELQQEFVTLHIVDDQGLLIGLRKQNVFFETVDLLWQRLWMQLVDTRFTDGRQLSFL